MRGISAGTRRRLNLYRRAGAVVGVNPKDSCDDWASVTEVDTEVAEEWGNPVTFRGRSVWAPRFLMGREWVLSKLNRPSSVFP